MPKQTKPTSNNNKKATLSECSEQEIRYILGRSIYDHLIYILYILFRRKKNFFDFSFKKNYGGLRCLMIKPYIKRFSFKISYFVINIFKNKLQITSLKFGDI